nr:unnamed protein product [Spirometra erinaceieuropaei]
MNKEDYTNKVDELLGDRTAYIPREGDTTKTLISEINKDLASLRKSKAITQLDWLRMKPKDSAIARFYGLPKVHKPGTPLRPIVSLRGTPTFSLAKWLFQRLKFLTQGSETSVHSAERFIEKLQGIRLTDDEVMVSFDVISLFTSIPHHLAVETLQTLLEEQYDETDKKLKIKNLIDLLKHCLKTFFTFNGAVYEQVKGTPMGSPLSSLIAEAVLQRLEALAFDHYRPRLWVRYVDDTFVIINRDKIGEFTQHLNSIFPDIQFTMEEEKDCQLPFLDVLVQSKGPMRDVVDYLHLQHPCHNPATKTADSPNSTTGYNTTDASSTTTVVTIPSTSRVNSIPIGPHCDRTFIGLVRH